MIIAGDRIVDVECWPQTLKGMRRLAAETVRWGGAETAAVLNALELLAVKALKIVPHREDGHEHDLPFEPVACRSETGIDSPIIVWRLGGKCEACAGIGTIYAAGKNDVTYTVDCPACGGGGRNDDNGSELHTDVDGLILYEDVVEC